MIELVKVGNHQGRGGDRRDQDRLSLRQGGGAMTQPSPAFTLIIPCHNTPAQDRRTMMRTLEATILDRPDLEVIWVDDHLTLPWQPGGDHAQTSPSYA